MLPAFRQRLMILAAVTVAGLVWLLVGPALAAPDASSGLSLFDARAGFVGALVLTLVAGLPAIALGLAMSSTGHPLAGVFVVSGALVLLGGRGGPIDGLLWRNDLPGVYLALVIETLLWVALPAAVLALVHRYRERVRRVLGPLATDQHFGEGVALGLPRGRALTAGLITAGAGGVLSNLLIQSTDTGQVIGALLLSFTIAGMLGQMLAPQPNPVAIVLSPLAVAVLGYAQVWLGYADGAAVLAAWYNRELSGLALALPIHYASAAVAGCVMGIGIAQSLDHAREHAVEA